MRENYTIKIKPGDVLSSLDLSELWHYRELFYLLVWRDMKVRYKQTLLGILWAILQPALTALIFTIIFSRVAKVETGEVPYWLFVLSGFTIWTFISSSVNMSANAFLNHTQLVTKVYFPRMILPASSVGAYFIDLLLTLVILFGALVYAGIPITWKIVLVPLFLIYLLALTIAASLLLSALNVRFRDVKFIIPFFLQVWLFISPVFYSSEWVSERLRYVFALNPVTGCLDGFRHVLFGTNLNYTSFAMSLGVTILLFAAAVFVFRRMEDDFADLL